MKRHGLLSATLIIGAQNKTQARDMVLYGFPYETEIVSFVELDPEVFEIQVSILEDVPDDWPADEVNDNEA